MLGSSSNKYMKVCHIVDEEAIACKSAGYFNRIYSCNNSVQPVKLESECDTIG
jgi:hypothetical protein